MYRFNHLPILSIATANDQQTMKLNNDPIKSAEEYKLYSFKFIGEFNSPLVSFN